MKKLFLSLIFFLICSIHAKAQLNEYDNLKNITEISIFVPSGIELPIIYKDNILEFNEFSEMLNQKIPNLVQVSYEQAETSMNLTFNVSEGDRNQFFGNIELTCTRIGKIVKTDYVGKFTVWHSRISFVTNNEHSENIGNLIYKSINDLLNEFAIDYYKAN